jgi:hypothetical protein
MPAAAAVGEGELGRRTWRCHGGYLYLPPSETGRPVDWLKRGTFFLTPLGGLKGAEMADAGT